MLVITCEKKRRLLHFAIRVFTYDELFGNSFSKQTYSFVYKYIFRKCEKTY